jgi:thiol:disulfide interchange protein DsbD
MIAGALVLAAAGVGLLPAEPASAAAPGPGPAAKPAAESIAWLTSEPAALARAKAEGKHVLIDFGATWCAACQELDHRTYTDPEVRSFVTAHFVPLKVDATDDTDAIVALENKYGVVGLPLVTVLDKDGHQLADPKITGYVGPADFLKQLQKIAF